MSNNTHTDTARTHIDETQQKTVGTIDGDCPSETFMSIIVNGVVMHGLIDTGCDHSVCGSAVLPPDIELKPTDIKLAAANGTNIFVRGITCLNFTVNGTEMYVNVLVSDDLSDALIFGFDWLKRNKALWDFEAGTLMFENVTVQLKHRSSRANVRRIYVQESIIVQAHTEANVPVKLLRSSLRGPKCDWVTTPKEVKSGLFMARTLLPDEGLSAVRFMNISDVDQTIDKGLLLGVAMPGFAVGVMTERLTTEINDKRLSYQSDQTDRLTERRTTDGGGCTSSLWPIGLVASERHQPDSLENLHDTESDDELGLQPPSGLTITDDGRINDIIFQRQAREVATVTATDGPTPTGTERYTETVDETVDGITANCIANDSCVQQLLDYRINSVDVISVPSVCSAEELHGDDGRFDFLRPIIDELPDILTDDQRLTVIDLLKRNESVFSKSELDVGLTDFLVHSINTGDAKPIAQPLRSHPRAYLDLIDQTIANLQAADIIEEACSPWNANIVLVARKNNPVPRVTVDLRALNNVSIKDKFPIPNISDCLGAMGNSVWFSVLDQSSSFHQIPLDFASRQKCAFSTRRGQFQYKRLPMGASNSPSVFCRLMAMVLKGLDYTTTLCYVDDTVVLGVDFISHVKNVEEVLNRFRQAGLKLQPKKCHMFQTSIRFLGYIISSQGVQLDPDKVASILEWEFPRNITELRGFLGVTSYHRSHVKNYSVIAEPLTEMLRKGVKIEWTERRQRAMDTLKQCLVNSPILSLPRDEGDYVVESDSSGTGCGGVLYQWQDGELRVIQYASRCYNRHERAYCTTRAEMTAVIFCLRQFKKYLLGRRFVLRVDHKALIYYQKTHEPMGQVARHLEFIAQFDFDLQYKCGSSLILPDALSRLRPCEKGENGFPCRQCNKRFTGHHVDSMHANRIRTRAQTKRELFDRTGVGTVPETDSTTTAATGRAAISLAPIRPTVLPIPTDGQPTAATQLAPPRDTLTKPHGADRSTGRPPPQTDDIIPRHDLNYFIPEQISRSDICNQLNGPGKRNNRKQEQIF